MAKSSKKAKGPEARQTRKQIAMGRKEARQNRIIWISVGIFALVVVGIVATGLIVEGLVKPAQPVATVNGTNIRTDDFQELLTYRRYNQHLNIQNLEQSLAGLNSDDEGTDFLRSFYEQQLVQLQSSLTTMHETTLDELIQDELIKARAEELGLTVTGDEVSQTINDDLRQAVAPPPQQAITDTEQLPTPTPIPQETIDEILDNALAAMGLTKPQFRKIVERSLLRQKLQDLLAGEVPTTGLVAHIQLIETDTQEEAEAAQVRIDSGEEMSLVAQEVSTDTLSLADGGDLGWVTPDQIDGRYGQGLGDQFFALEEGQLALVKGDESFYLVKVIERDENGPLPDSVLQPLQSNALGDWLNERLESPDVVIERSLDLDSVPPDPFLSGGF